MLVRCSRHITEPMRSAREHRSYWQAHCPEPFVPHVWLWLEHRFPLHTAPTAPTGHGLSTQRHEPVTVPGTHAQNGKSNGHGPPQIAVPAPGSPLTTPHAVGGDGGIGHANFSMRLLVGPLS